MPAECLDRVHAPIGLAIGAITPAEIAVSILAELIAVRHGVDATPLAMSSRRKTRRTTKETKEQEAKEQP